LLTFLMRIIWEILSKRRLKKIKKKRVEVIFQLLLYKHDSYIWCNGAAEKLDLPYLGAFLDSLGTNFHHGANFAASGATIEPATGLLIDSGFNPLSLEIQLSQFDQFKNRTIELHTKGEKFDLPMPEDFSKALYTIDIGQNDLHFKLITVTLTEVFDYIPDLVNQTSLAIEVSARKSSLGGIPFVCVIVGLLLMSLHFCLLRWI